MRSYLFLEHYVTVIDKKTITGPEPVKFTELVPNILTASGVLVK